MFSLNVTALSLHATVLSLLRNWDQYSPEAWTVHGFGFLRFRLDDDVRLHLWDSRLRIEGVHDIHDHAQWSFKSLVVWGEIGNTRFSELDAPDLSRVTSVSSYKTATIHAGMGGKLNPESIRQTWLAAYLRERHQIGQCYGQVSGEIHRTDWAEGTVTIIHQKRTSSNSARVFWPLGEEWVAAFPRVATPGEVGAACKLALKTSEVVK